ncbi:MAG: hypothetical protein N3E41_07660 [Thermofilaceae archaeon]|nr:hypothetical protein [Thermofilaceae archaeon]
MAAEEKALTTKVILMFLFTAFILQPLVIYYFLLTNSFYTFSYWIPVLIFAEVASLMRADFTNKELFMLLVFQPVAFSYSLFFINFIRNMYFAYSEPSKYFGIAYHVPGWWVPPEEIVSGLYSRGWIFVDAAWAVPTVLALSFLALTVLMDLSLGYLSYMIFVVEEKLEFPFARASIAMVNTLASREHNALRTLFASCAAGILLNLALKFLPYTLSAFLLGGTFVVITPFYGYDFTPYLDYILPGAAFMLVTDPLAYLSGLLIPPIVAVTQFAASFALYFIGSHVITRLDLWPAESKWATGWGYWTLQYRVNLYFYVSLLIGMSLAAMLVPLAINPRPLARAFKSLGKMDGRGRFSAEMLLGAFLASSLAMTILAWYLTNFQFPIYVLLLLVVGGSFFATYIATASAGVTVFGTSVPYLRELAIYMSGYTKRDVWFVPLPATLSSAPLGTAGVSLASPLGGSSVAQALLQSDVVGVRHREFISAYLLLVLINIVSSFIITNIFWNIAPIPSSAYPYTITGWPVDALNWARMQMWVWTGYLFRPLWMGLGFAVGAALFAVTNFVLKAPYLLIVTITGAGMGIPWALSQMLGSIIGRRVLSRTLGDRWGSYMYLIVTGLFLGDAIMEMLRVLMIIMARAQWLLPF